MDVWEAIAARRSYRGMYADTPVPRADLARIVTAGLSAPSGCNKQTTTLLALDDAALIKKVAALMEAPHFASAPAAVCVLTRPIIAYRDRTFYVQDYSAAIENMLLAIVSLGYASCWVEGHITDADRIGRRMADLLGVPPEYEMAAYLPVGVPLGGYEDVKKIPFAARAFYNGFGKTE